MWTERSDYQAIWRPFPKIVSVFYMFYHDFVQFDLFSPRSKALSTRVSALKASYITVYFNGGSKIKENQTEIY